LVFTITCLSQLTAFLHFALLKLTFFRLAAQATALIVTFFTTNFFSSP
jgi:hypothetical protein